MPESTVLTGWGRTPRSHAEVRPLNTGIHLSDKPRGQLARGLGRSYGDAALNSGGVIWDATGLDSIEIDVKKCTAQLGGGVSYLDLLRVAVPAGLFPPVTPGTKFVTIGGAVAADVHGKNHHKDGSIGRHVESITMITGDSETVEITDDDELFAATVGGMGLTGIILGVTLKMIKIGSPLMSVDTVRTSTLTETIDSMEARDADHRYSVAWVDLTHRSQPGRGVVTFGDHAPSGDLNTWTPSRSLAVPDLMPSTIVNPVSVRAFNEVWYRKAPNERSGESQNIDQFFYPLDVAKKWNRLYGRTGLIQYQMVVPFGREDVLEDAVMSFNSGATPPSLAVLKRFGEARGLLSFPIPGWTLSVDFPAQPELSDMLDRIDQRVADAGGRVYLAKDSRLRAALVPKMYPELDRWRQLADKTDPTRRFRSDLDRRLALRDS